MQYPHPCPTALMLTMYTTYMFTCTVCTSYSDKGQQSTGRVASCPPALVWQQYRDPPCSTKYFCFQLAQSGWALMYQLGWGVRGEIQVEYLTYDAIVPNLLNLGFSRDSCISSPIFGFTFFGVVARWCKQWLFTSISLPPSPLLRVCLALRDSVTRFSIIFVIKYLYLRPI